MVYYTLLMLDKQLAVTEETALLWEKSVETIKAMKIGGMTNEAAVAQSEANSYMIAASIPALRQQIREARKTVCPHCFIKRPNRFERGTFEDQELPEMLQVGVPVQLLSNRPRCTVGRALVGCGILYYEYSAVCLLSQTWLISGSAGWTNSAGSMIVNPGKVLLSAAASLVTTDIQSWQ